HASKKEMAVRNRKVRVFSLFMVVLIFMSLIYVWTRIKVVQLGYEVSRLSVEIKELSQQKSILEADVAKLKSPARMEGLAQSKLGMRLPHGDEVVFIEQ
ncbi:MAG: cell division protein FtsL, partial [Deltaproteobacteria bacterium CG07_land_8_20_14_0_80_38_7]